MYDGIIITKYKRKCYSTLYPKVYASEGLNRRSRVCCVFFLEIPCYKRLKRQDFDFVVRMLMLVRCGKEVLDE